MDRVGDSRLALQRLLPLVQLVLEPSPLLVLVLLLAVGRGGAALLVAGGGCGPATFTAAVLATRVFCLALATAFSALLVIDKNQ